VRIRHYGLLANRCRKDNLRLCRRLLGSEPESDTEPTRSTETASSPDLCPACQQGQMLTMAKLPPSRAGPEPRMNAPHAA